MSADEFDPAIERLFSRAPTLADDGLFAAEVQARLEKRSRWRALALTTAGVIGGCVAVREGVSINFTGSQEGATVSRGVQAAAVTAQGAVQSGLDSLGVGSFDLMNGTGLMTFWITAGAVLVLLAAGAVRLSQDA